MLCGCLPFVNIFPAYQKNIYISYCYICQICLNDFQFRRLKSMSPQELAWSEYAFLLTQNGVWSLGIMSSLIWWKGMQIGEYGLWFHFPFRDISHPHSCTEKYAQGNFGHAALQKFCFFLFLFLFFFQNIWKHLHNDDSEFIALIWGCYVKIFCRGVTINHSCYICIIWRKIFFKKWNNQQMLPETVWEDQSFMGKNLIFTILWVFRLMLAGTSCIKDFHACRGWKLEIFNFIGAIFLFSFFNYMGWILVVIGVVVVHFLSPAFLVIRSWFKKPEYNIYCQNIVWMTEYLGLEFCILYIDFTRMLYMESK